MSEALQSFPKNAWQKSLSLGLIATIFFTSIPMPAFAAAAETSFFYYHHGDHLGSTNVITEGNTSAIHSGITYAKGDIVQRFEYSPYGQESYVLNPSLDLEVSYTGQDYDVESGLYYYNARYYNPQLGRFIQPDTMIPDPTNLQAYNRYSYVQNNPLKYTDPSGHSFFTAASNFFFGSSTTGGTSLAGQIMTAGYTNTEGGEIPGTTHIEGPTDAQTKSPIGEVAIQYKEEALPMATDGIPGDEFGSVPDSYDQIGFSNTEIIIAVVAFIGLTAVIYTGLGKLAVVAGAAGFVRTHPEAIEGMAGEGSTIIQQGMPIFRVYGNGASAFGKSWTPIDPSTILNYRNLAGLPDENTGRFIIEGIIKNTNGMYFRNALPLDGNAGGISEILVLDAINQIQIMSVQGVNPTF